MALLNFHSMQVLLSAIVLSVVKGGETFLAVLHALALSDTFLIARATWKYQTAAIKMMSLLLVFIGVSLFVSVSRNALCIMVD